MASPSTVGVPRQRNAHDQYRVRGVMQLPGSPRDVVASPSGSIGGRSAPSPHLHRRGMTRGTSASSAYSSSSPTNQYQYGRQPSSVPPSSQAHTLAQQQLHQQLDRQHPQLRHAPTAPAAAGGTTPHASSQTLAPSGRFGAGTSAAMHGEDGASMSQEQLINRKSLMQRFRSVNASSVRALLGRNKAKKAHKPHIKTATQLMHEKEQSMVVSMNQIKTEQLQGVGTPAMLKSHSFSQQRESKVDTKAKRRQHNTCCVLRPQSPIRLTWDVTTLFMLLYIAVTTPYQIGFSVEAEGMQWYFERAVDVFFICDLFLNFRTGYVTQSGKDELRTCKIVKNYLAGWFWIDGISSIPFDFIFAGLDSLKGTKVLKAGRVVKAFRVVRLTKLVRFLKLGVFIEKLEVNFSINRNLLQLVKLLLGTVVMCHFFACTWFLIGSIPDAPIGWVASEDLLNAGSGTQYLASFYWAVATLATVGYGDVVPITKEERTFAVVGMLLGGGYFGYIIATMASLVAKLDASTQKYHDKMDAHVSYKKSRNLPRELQMRIRRYYKHYLEKKTAFDEGSILSELSTFLRQEVAMFLVNDTLYKIPLFERVGPGFIANLLTVLQPLTCGVGDIVMQKGEYGREMYIVIRGELEMSPYEDLPEAPGSDSPELVLLTPGSYFGHMAVLYEHHYQRRETVRGLEHCEMYSLNRDDLLRICREFPAVLQAMRRVAREDMRGLHQEWRARGIALSDIDSDSDGALTTSPAHDHDAELGSRDLEGLHVINGADESEFTPPQSQSAEELKAAQARDHAYEGDSKEAPNGLVLGKKSVNSLRSGPSTDSVGDLAARHGAPPVRYSTSTSSGGAGAGQGAGCAPSSDGVQRGDSRHMVRLPNAIDHAGPGVVSIGAGSSSSSAAASASSSSAAAAAAATLSVNTTGVARLVPFAASPTAAAATTPQQQLQLRAQVVGSDTPSHAVAVAAAANHKSRLDKAAYQLRMALSRIEMALADGADVLPRASRRRPRPGSHSRRRGSREPAMLLLPNPALSALAGSDSDDGGGTPNSAAVAGTASASSAAASGAGAGRGGTSSARLRTRSRSVVANNMELPRVNFLRLSASTGSIAPNPLVNDARPPRHSDGRTPSRAGPDAAAGGGSLFSSTAASPTNASTTGGADPPEVVELRRRLTTLHAQLMAHAEALGDCLHEL